MNANLTNYLQNSNVLYIFNYEKELYSKVGCQEFDRKLSKKLL